MRILTIGAKPILARALSQTEGLEVAALTNAAHADDARCEVLPYAHGSKLDRTSIRQVRAAIRDWRPDLVHAFYPRPLAHAVLAAISLRSPTPIASYRGVTSVPARWSPDQWITYRSSRVVAHACESAAVAEALVASGVSRERCYVVHNCLRELPASLPRDKARRQLGIEPGEFVVMMIANMRHVKGADVLLQAAKQCADVRGLRLVLIGKVLDEQIERLAFDPSLRDRVTMVGFRSNAAELLSAADLFVMPSRAEALCMAVVEAMAAGVCPIVSSAGGMKEAVRHEQDGLVFPSEDAPALAAAVRSLAADPAKRATLAESAAERAATYFSAEPMASRLLEMYRAVLESPCSETRPLAA